MDVLQQMSDGVWSPWLLGAFLLSGLLFSLRSGFFQLFGLPVWLRATAGRLLSRGEQQGRGALSQFQAMATALAATIGTGSIAGVATAICCGGPGAVFWMWASALLGMMTGFVEKTLAVRYRIRDARGWRGGPMEYMAHCPGGSLLSRWFALAVTAAALGGGGLVQANSIAAGLHAAAGWNPLAVGMATALLTALVVFGGIGRIGRVCEALVPLMALLFLTGGCAALALRAQAVLPALTSIFREAFRPRSALGGCLGCGMARALRYGVARGVFTNEAGLGSSAMAHAQARVSHPALQGFWGIFEVFVSTLVVCTVSALVILTSGCYDPALPADLGLTGAPLAAAAFGAALGPLGEGLLAVCLVLFAFSSLLGWSYYGERGLEHLTGGRGGRRLFRLLFLTAILAGSTGSVTAVWQLSDLCSAMMAIPNLTALLLLSPEAFRLLEEWNTRPPARQ